MEKREMIKKIIINAMIDSYKQQAEHQNIDANKLIQDNEVGMDIFATELAAKISLVMDNA
jgi:hypothetical protein